MIVRYSHLSQIYRYYLIFLFLWLPNELKVGLRCGVNFHQQKKLTVEIRYLPTLINAQFMIKDLPLGLSNYTWWIIIIKATINVYVLLIVLLTATTTRESKITDHDLRNPKWSTPSNNNNVRHHYYKSGHIQNCYCHSGQTELLS
jgi:hypothetical protein